MGTEKNYYLGLDMGTSSLGWALTNEYYELLRAKGKDLWGVRLFDEAKTSIERRTNRITRRRRQREKARLGLVREYFAEEIAKVDQGFLQRCEESKYHQEDRSEKNRQPFALFADTGFTDVEYYAKYPTIFHLRKELIESKEKHDVRLVYLAILNMFKHRGHFLNTNLDNISVLGNLDQMYGDLVSTLVTIGIIFPTEVDCKKIEEILTQKNKSRTAKKEELVQYLNFSKTNEKQAIEIITLLCGMSAKVSALFGDDVEDEEIRKKSFSFRDSDYEEKIYEIERELSDESIDVIEKVKCIHDVCLLSSIRKGHTYLSQARVADYEKHQSDLDKLQVVIKKYVSKEYDTFFRTMGTDNYSAYVGSVNSSKEKTRRCGKIASREDFYKSVKKILNSIPSDDKEIASILEDIDAETFLPKQLTASNGVIPNQLHKAELQVILKNASEYLSFLNEKDESGKTVCERIVQLFSFQIPYYVGPLNDFHKNNGGTAWVVRKEKGTVLPWNIEEKVDIKESRKEFIQRMVRRCTYLNDEKVLPKNSLLYEKFMVLNELNNLRVRQKEIPVDLKQDIYQDLFMTGKRVTGKRLREYLIAKGVIAPTETEAISGIDKDFHTSLSSMGKFIGVLGERAKEWEMQKKIENIIFWGTVYSNDKKVVKESIEEHYPDIFSEEELYRILGFKFRDWGKLSKEFFEMQGANKETGEILSIIQALWNNNVNLMELLSDRYTYKDELNARIQNIGKTLSEFTYEDLEDMNLSAPVRRMIWQALLVVKDLQNVVTGMPKRIFVEMARGGGKKGERKASRKKKFEELYKKCKDDGRDWSKEILDTDEGRFRSKKLYLYYLQKGRCMYTGEIIELADLFNDNKYDIDHIYPRHFVKDDNIDNNLVLVKKEKNAHKSDTFPIEPEIQRCQMGLWKSLHDGGFINDEKYKRLTRKDEFSESDLAGFISRQLVETHQGTRIITSILKEVFPESEIVFPKGENISEFRRTFELLKVRNVNDFHHAQDAYLNIVVGNAYYVKFTRNPMNYVKDFYKDRNKYAYNMGKMFERTIERNGYAAWVASEKGTIVIVKKVMARNTPLITRMNFEAHGGIANQTVYSAKKAKDSVYLPLKTSDEHLCDVTKYGGVTNISTSYFFLVEHGKKEKRIRTIEMVPVYLKQKIEDSDEKLLEYCEGLLGLRNPSIRMAKIKIQSLIKYNGFCLHITGRTGPQLLVRNAMPMCLKQEWISYIKEINRFVEKDLTMNDITTLTKENNLDLFDVLLEKHTKKNFSKKPNAIGGKLEMWREGFVSAEFSDQVETLSEVLKMSECNNLSMEIKSLGLKAGVMKIGNNVSNSKEFKLVNQSPSGLYESVIDLKTI